MLHEQLRNAWRGRERAIPISPVLHFVPEGLILGAGTVLLAVEGARRLKKLAGQEARVLALLSAAYGRLVAPRVLGNIERAAKAWSEGDDCLAYIHLAHAGLPELQDREAARRLFVADSLIKAGAAPYDIVEALGLSAAFAGPLEKLYNEQEPRVPKGSGRPSGQWTRLFSFLGGLSEEAAKDLGRSALRLLGLGAAVAAPEAGVALVGGVATLGLIFIPSNRDIRVEGEVSGLPGLRYSWNRDETLLHLFYTGDDGEQRTFAAQLENDVFRDAQGHVVGRLLPGDTIAIDPAAVSNELVKKDEPKLCPTPGKDKVSGRRGRDYEDFVKRVVNPPPDVPTPRGLGYQLPNPQKGGKLVYYDDCQHKSGILVEAKGPGYTKLLKYHWGVASLSKRFVDQALRQIQASGGRPIRWYFAEREAAVFAEELFRNNHLEQIKVEFLPWTRDDDQ